MIDLLVAGGGPVGLATAIFAAQAGLEPVVVEPRGAPIDKACGEGLMPPAVAALAAMGVALPAHHRFEGIRYLDARLGEARGAVSLFQHGPGLGVRRTALHAAISAAADTLGIRRIQDRIGAFEQRADRVVALGLEARWGVIADGLNSPLRRGLGLDLPPRRPARVGLRRHFAVAPWSDLVEVYWGDAAEAYVTPVGADQVGVAILCQKAALPPGEGQRPFERLLAGFPALQARLGEPCTTPRGAGPFEHRVSQRVAGRLLLVGDAAGYLDPLTGEGMRLGFETASILVDCLKHGRPEDYERRWRRAVRAGWWGTAALLWVASHGWSRRAILPTVQAAPWVMDLAMRALLA